jgi:hypothetical protein
VNDAHLLSEYQRRERAELDGWAEQQAAAPPESKSQYLAPIGPPAPPPGSQPGTLSRGAAAAGSAVAAGARRGFEALAEGSKNVMEGLVKATSAVPLTTSAGGEWTARMQAVKQVVDGLFQVGLSPVTAVTGIVGEAAPSGVLDQPLLDPYVSGTIRAFFGGYTGDFKSNNQPMTGQEVLDLVGGLLAIGGAHAVAGRGGKAPTQGGEAPSRGGEPSSGAPRALPGGTGQPRALPAPRMGERAPVIDLGPGERYQIIETLQKEGKWQPLVDAIEQRRAAAQPREAAGAPGAVEGRPPEPKPGQLVSPQGRPVEAGPLTMTEREYLRARERTPLSAEESQAARTQRLYGEDLAPVGDAVERAVAEEITKAPPTDEPGFTAFAKLIDEAAAKEIAGGSEALTRADTLGSMYADLQNATAGSRSRSVQRVEGKGKVETFTATPSTYPAVIDELGVPRTRKGADRIMAAIDDVLAGRQEGTLQTKIAQLADRLAEERNYLDEVRREQRAGEQRQRTTDLGLTGERGSTSVSTVTALARMAVGALVGGSTGDTPEERVRNAFLGAGLGALLSARLAKAVIQNVSKEPILKTLRDESGIIRIPNFRTIETSEKVKGFMRRMADDEVFQKETERQARGVRSHDETDAAALRLIKAGRFRASRVLDADEGTIWNAEEARAARLMTQAAANRVVTIATDVKAGRATLDDLNAAMALSARMTVNTHAVMTEQGRALNALGMRVSGDVPLKISPERLAEEATKWPRDERLPDMVASLADEAGPEAVGRFARLRQALPDALLEVYYGVAMLSNPMTQFRNIAGNSMALAGALYERQVSGVLALHPFRDPAKPHVALGEAGQMALTVAESWLDALRLAGRTAKEGVNVTKLDIPTREPAMTAERLGVDPGTPWGAGLDYLGKYARFNLKLLEGEDTFFKILNFNAEHKALALRQAEFEGLTGHAKADRVADLWAQPPEWLMQEAWKFAEEQTFSRGFEGRMRSMQQALSHPLTRMTVLPFFRTPLRLAEYAAERTPVVNLVTAQFYSDIQTGGARREIALGKLGTGAAIGAGVGYLVLQDLITGNPPKDAEERKRLEDAGVRWLSIYNPATRTYHSYGNLEPISSVVAVIADTVNLLRRAPDVDSLPTQVLQAVTAATMSAVRNLNDRQYLQSVKDFIDAVRDPNTDKALRLAEKRLASWVPAVVAQAERIVDPVIRETETLLDEIQAKIPWLSESLVPRRSIITGQPITGAPTFYGERSADPVLNEIARLEGAGIRAPVPAVAGPRPSNAPVPMEPEHGDPGIPLTKRQYDQLLVFMTTHKAGARTLHEALGELIATESYQRQTEGRDGGKALLLRRTVDAYKAAARDWMAGQLAPQLLEREQKRQRRLTPNADALSGSLAR